MLWLVQIVRYDPARPWIVVGQTTIEVDAPDPTAARDRARELAPDGWDVAEWAGATPR